MSVYAWLLAYTHNFVMLKKR